MRIRRIVLLVLGLATCGVVHAADGPYPKGLAADAGVLPAGRLAPGPGQRRAVQGDRDQHLRRALAGADRGAARCPRQGRHPPDLRAERAVAAVQGPPDDRRLDARRRARQRPVARPGQGVRAADPAGQDRRGVREDPQGRPRPPRAAEPRARAWPGTAGTGGACGRTTRRTTRSTSRAATSPPSTSTRPATRRRRSPATSGTCPRGSIASGAGPRAEGRVVLHRDDRDRQRGPQADAAAGPVGGVDGPDPRGQGDHLLRPPVQAEVHRGRAPGRRGDGPRGGGHQPADPRAGPGPEQPRRGGRGDRGLVRRRGCRSTSWSSGMPARRTCSRSP